MLKQETLKSLTKIDCSKALIIAFLACKYAIISIIRSYLMYENYMDKNLSRFTMGITRTTNMQL